MEGNSTVALAAIGLVSAILALVVSPLFKLLRENTNATKDQTKEIAKGNYEAKVRNGHLGEQNIHLAEQSKTILEILTNGQNDILRAVQTVNVQHVLQQDVDKSNVKQEIIEEKGV